MPASKYKPDVLAKLGDEIFDRQVKPSLKPEDNGKFVVIDVDTGDYEINEDDYTAVMRLLERKPEADGWLMRVGFRAACRIGLRNIVLAEGSSEALRPTPSSINKKSHKLTHTSS